MVWYFNHWRHQQWDIGVGACAPLDFQQFISFSFWSYTNYDSNFLYEISSGFCIPQLLTFGSFSVFFWKKWKGHIRFFVTLFIHVPKPYFVLFYKFDLSCFDVILCPPPSSCQILAMPLLFLDQVTFKWPIQHWSKVRGLTTARNTPLTLSFLHPKHLRNNCIALFVPVFRCHHASTLTFCTAFVVRMILWIVVDGGS